MKNLRELSRTEACEIEGGGILSAIRQGIAAYQKLREFFSGRSQL